jgi:hypothetical protein
MRDNLAVPWPLSIPAVLDRRDGKGSRHAPIRGCLFVSRNSEKANSLLSTLEE